MKKNEEHRVTPSSGNVFADLGFADAAEMAAKANLALRIRSVINDREMTQTEAAALLQIDQPKISAIINGRVDGFSTERLMRVLNDLGCDVVISVSAPHPQTRGSVIFS